MIGALSCYASSPPRFGSAGGAIFASALHPIVPEDAYDAGPEAEGSYLFVGDVRIDNRSELQNRLCISPAEVKTLSDSSLLFRAWQRWDRRCLDWIVGNFAFALYDYDRRCLLLVRDHLGYCPLFFAQDGSVVAFASMPQGLLAVPHFRKGFDEGVLAFAVAGYRPENGSTYFRGIRAVGPGEIVEISSNAVTRSSYWAPSLEPMALGTPDAYVPIYRELLTSAVNASVRRTQGPLAVHLSSGLDSSAVAATAAKCDGGNGPIIAFTAAPGPSFQEPAMRHRFADESEAAGRIASAHGMQHRVCRSSRSGYDYIRNAVASSQEPVANHVNLDWFEQIGESARAIGAGTLLDGDIGNHAIHAGGLPSLADLLGAGRFRQWWSEARKLAAGPNVRWRGILLNSFEPWLPGAARRFVYRKFQHCVPRSRSAFLSRKWIEKFGPEIDAQFFVPRSANVAKDRLAGLLRWDGGVHRKGVLARHGVDVRSPLGDRRLVEFSLRLPPEALLHDGEDRPLARRALADRLPSEILNASKRGYQSADWNDFVDPARLRETVARLKTSPLARDLIDFERIEGLLDNWPRSGTHRYDLFEQMAVDLPNAVAVGEFIQFHERNFPPSAAS